MEMKDKSESANSQHEWIVEPSSAALAFTSTRKMKSIIYSRETKERLSTGYVGLEDTRFAYRANVLFVM